MAFTNIDANKSPGENMRAIHELMSAARTKNNTYFRKYTEDTRKLNDSSLAEHGCWERHSLKMAALMEEFEDEQHPMVLQLSILITNSKNRLLFLQEQAKKVRDMFDEEQMKYKRAQEFLRNDLSYFIKGRLALNPPALPEEAKYVTTELPSVVPRKGQQRGSRFLSFGYFLGVLGIRA